MLGTFTAAKIFDTAIQVERNGNAFYLKAAQLTPQRALKHKFLELAAAEAGHLRTFTKLKEMLLGPGRALEDFDPESGAAAYLRTFSKSGIFNMTLDAALALSAETNMHDILHFAIGREQDSIMFFTGVREAMSKRRERDTVNSIIYEEMTHYVVLSQQLRKL